MSGHRAGRGDDRGAILVLSALVMTVLLAFAGLAIDLTNARQERRQAQGAADASALAAAQDSTQAAAVATAKDYALRNYDIPLTAWTGCSDSGALPTRPDVANNNTCISLLLGANNTISKVRVRLPITKVKTLFAQVVGIKNIDVTATAEAKITYLEDSRTLPATILASDGTGLKCVENSGNDTTCANRNSGNFGSIDSPRLNVFFPTSPNQKSDPLTINYALGLDHPLSAWAGSTRVCDGTTRSPCTTNNANGGAVANHLVSVTGNANKGVADGLVDNATIGTTDYGSTLFCGRLRRPDLTDENLADPDPANCNHWTTATPRINVLGDAINGRHVAYWMNAPYKALFYPEPGTDPATVPTTSGVWGAGDARLACFLKSFRFNYTTNATYFIDPTKPVSALTGDGVAFTTPNAVNYLQSTCGLTLGTTQYQWTNMFKTGIATDARYASLPAIQTWSSGSSSGMPIARFWSTYLYTLYTNNGGTQLKAVDGWVFEPALIQTPDGIPRQQFSYVSSTPIVVLVK